MTALWLLLYVAWLVRNLAMLTVDGRSWATFLMVLPLLLLPVSAWLRDKRPGLFHSVLTPVAGILALASALVLGRLWMLDYWDTRQVAASALLALLGLSLQWVMMAWRGKIGGLRLWLWIAFWEYVGGWHPALTLLGAGLGAFLAGLQWLPAQAPAQRSRHTVGVWPMMLLLGLVLPKPAWDHLLEPAWALAFSAFAFGVALASIRRMRGLGERLPTNSLLGAMALLFVIYFPLHTGWWALALGLIGGWLWQRLPRPLPAPKLTAAFLLGLLLSFLLHANSGRPVVKHFVWPGGGSERAGL